MMDTDGGKLCKEQVLTYFKIRAVILGEDKKNTVGKHKVPHIPNWIQTGLSLLRGRLAFAVVS
jgi:hypothetical protein